MTSTSLFRHRGPARWLGRGGSGWQQGELALQAIPPALRSLDAAFEAEWRGGAFALAGFSVTVGGGSPFAVAEAPRAWLEALHGFGWLRHVAPHNEVDAGHIEAVVWDWLRRARFEQAVAREDGVTARRILSWLAHADVLLQTSDPSFYDAVLEALRADITALERRAASIEGARDRLLAMIALAEAGLSIGKAAPLLRAAETAIAEEFAHPTRSFRQLLRTPDEVADLALDLEALRLLYGMQGLPAAPAITRARDVFSSVLSGLLLDGDRLARLGSARLSTERGPAIASVTRHIGLASSPSCHNQDAGFVRLVMADTTLVADVGAPLLSRDALALELSSGAAPMLVHDGREALKGERSRGTLVTAPADAASAGTEPARFGPTLEPTHCVEVEIDGSALASFDATHAGAALGGHAHRRRVVLSQAGRHVDGVDELRPLIGRAEAPAFRFAVRFVLHPSVAVALCAAPDQLELTASNGHRWRLVVPGRAISVEGSLYRDGSRTVPTLQVLVPAGSKDNRTVAWHWVRLDAGASDEESE